MHSPLKLFLTALGLLCALSDASICAAPTTTPSPPAKTTTPAKPSSPPAKPAPAKAVAKPPALKPAAPIIADYGARENAPLPVSDTAPNPLAQAGRAMEALVIVLAGVIGVIYALKRFGLVTPGANGRPGRIALPPLGLRRFSASAAPASSPITVVSSQTLPGGTMLHVVTVAGRTLLLAATGHTVTTVAEWMEEQKPSEEAKAFEDFLSRAEPEPVSGIAAANARLRSLLSTAGERA